MKDSVNYRNFLVVRPLPEGYILDKFGNPLLHHIDYSDIVWEDVKFVNYTNLSRVKEREKCAFHLFLYDYVLDRIWRDPFKFFKRVEGFLLVATPDFSVYYNMNQKEIEHNIFKSRWIAAWAQFFGLKILITVTWGHPDTFDLCFSGIPKGIPVLISTIGCQKRKKEFLLGFNEMKKQLNPPLIIVYGKPIRGMIGKFIFVDFKETFNVKEKYFFIPLLELPRIIEIKEEENYGW